MNVRKTAFTILTQVIINKKYSNLALRDNDLSDERDQALLNEIVYGTLQNYDYLSYQWLHYVKKIPTQEVQCLLNMSIYQLIYLDKVPAYAIVDEAITIAKTIDNGRFKGLCNAILRKFINEGITEVKMDDPIEKVALMTSHPLWLVRMWQAHYGKEIAIALCEHNNKRKPLSLRVNTSLISKEELLKDERFTEGKLAPSAVYYDGNIFKSAYFDKGEVIVQDESSQYVSYFVDPKPHDKILDLCSAPGTKATHMAIMMNDTGVIDALDIHPHRVELIKELSRKLKLNSIKAQVLDALKVDEHLELASYDLVLLDAPCSGLGVISHKPEIKLTIIPGDIDELVSLQQQMLTKAALMVKPKGYLVYATCTLNKKENEKQVQSFLVDHQDFNLIQDKTIMPMDYGSDGFYMAKLQRIR